MAGGGRGKLFRPGAIDVPDEPEALEAAGLCGAPNYRKPGAAVAPGSDAPKYRYCHRPKNRGRRRCTRHNGNAPRGPAAPGWGKARAAAGERRERPSRAPAGKYSAILGGDYAEAYATALADLTLTDLKEQIALCDVREAKLVRLVEERRRERGETGAAWNKARSSYHAARKAGRAGDADAFNRSLEELGDVIKAGAGEEDAWRELRENMLVRRRLVQTQRQLIAVNGDYMARPELKVIAAQLIELFREVLHDRKMLDRAVERVGEIMTEAARVPVEPAGIIGDGGSVN